MLNVGELFQIGDPAVQVVGLVLLEWGAMKLISDIQEGNYYYYFNRISFSVVLTLQIEGEFVV